MKKKIIRAAAVILVLTVALSFAFSGCSNKKDGGDETTTMPPEAVEAVQTLKLPYSKGDKLNPFTATSMLNQQLMPLIYDGLFTLDKNYNPQPLLASNYSRSGRTLTVSLASAKFSTVRASRLPMLSPRLRARRNRPHIKLSLRISAAQKSAGTA